MEKQCNREEKVHKNKWLKRLLLVLAAQLVLVASIVIVFDPFYQYHAPWFGLEAVLNDRDNQMPGTVRNFSYDSVLVGSSVAENFDSDFLDAAYGGETLKIIRASGSVADLLYYLKQAHERQELNQVFWCLDIFALDASTEVTLYDDSVPKYLHTRTILDDLPYLFNKEILFEKIPYMLACSWKGINTGGKAYDWSRDKNFSAEATMSNYYREPIGPEVEIPQKAVSEKQDLIQANIQMLLEEIEAHPNVQYRFLVPPYSLIWWDTAYLNGDLEENLYSLEQAFAALIPLENVEVYFFQAEADIVCNLDYYMDMVHYSPDINQYMLDCMVAGDRRLTAENWQEELERMRELAVRISKEEIYRYSPLEQ